MRTWKVITGLYQAARNPARAYTRVGLMWRLLTAARNFYHAAELAPECRTSLADAVYWHDIACDTKAYFSALYAYRRPSAHPYR